MTAREIASSAEPLPPSGLMPNSFSIQSMSTSIASEAFELEHDRTRVYIDSRGSGVRIRRTVEQVTRLAALFADLDDLATARDRRRAWRGRGPIPGWPPPRPRPAQRSPTPAGPAAGHRPARPNAPRRTGAATSRLSGRNPIARASTPEPGLFRLFHRGCFRQLNVRHRLRRSRDQVVAPFAAHTYGVPSFVNAALTACRAAGPPPATTARRVFSLPRAAGTPAKLPAAAGVR